MPHFWRVKLSSCLYLACDLLQVWGTAAFYTLLQDVKSQQVALEVLHSDCDLVDRTIHYSDVIMGAMASQVTSVSIVYSAVCSGRDQREHQSSASLAFMRGIHQWPVNSPHKGPVTQKMVPFDDVIMSQNTYLYWYCANSRWPGCLQLQQGIHISCQLHLPLARPHPTSARTDRMDLGNEHGNTFPITVARLTKTWDVITLRYHQSSNF